MYRNVSQHRWSTVMAQNPNLPHSERGVMGQRQPLPLCLSDHSDLHSNKRRCYDYY